MPAVIDRDRWLIIANPASGNGRARRLAPRLVEALRSAGVPHELAVSRGRGDCAALAAAAAAAGARRFFAVGGDGTLHELVNGIASAGVPLRDCLVGAAPAGTGNDWACTHGVPGDAGRIAACLRRARARPLDLGFAASATGRAAFHTVAGAGLDAEVIRRTPRRGPRRLAYLAGLAGALARFRAPVFSVVADGEAVEGRFLIVLAAIGPRCGGGMRLAPAARPDDGWLELVTVNPVPPGSAVRRLPWLFDGRLAGDPAYGARRCRQVEIGAEPHCGVELDGEPFGSTPMSLGIERGALHALDCTEGPVHAGAGSSGRTP